MFNECITDMFTDEDTIKKDMQMYSPKIVTMVNYITQEYPINYWLLTSNKETIFNQPYHDTNEFPRKCELSRNQLYKLTENEIEKIFLEFKEHENNLINHLTKSHAFNYENTNANYHYWKQIPFWSIEQATLLILGKDPLKLKKADFAGKMLPVDQNFHQIYNEIYHAAKLGAIGEIKTLFNEQDLTINPESFIEWCYKIGREVPSELKALFPQDINQNTISTNEKKSQAKMIVGMMYLLEKLTETPISRLLSTHQESKTCQKLTLEQLLNKINSDKLPVKQCAKTLKKYFDLAKKDLGIE